jgi:hypothetical protein
VFFPVFFFIFFLSEVSYITNLALETPSYGTKANTERKFHAFSDHFAAVWAVPVLQGLLSSLQTWVAGHYMPPKVLALHLKYLDAACVLRVFVRLYMLSKIV